MMSMDVFGFLCGKWLVIFGVGYVGGVFGW